MKPLSAEDSEFLEQAIAVGTRSVQEGGGPFGACIVGADGRRLAAEGNRVVLGNDPTAHAEVMAIRAACRELQDPALIGATLYSSCEPCPMCLGAALWARVARVVFAATRHDAAAAGFDDSAFYREFGRDFERESAGVASAAAEPPVAGSTTADSPAAEPLPRLPRFHLELPSALEPFEAWRRFDQARPY